MKPDILLEQFLGEKHIELSQDVQGEIESRLAVLRKDGVKPNEGTYISNLHDSSGSDEDVDKITKKVFFATYVIFATIIKHFILITDNG